MSRWLVAKITSSIPWATNEVEVEYCGYKILIRPSTEKYAPTICIENKNTDSNDEAIYTLRNFMSSWAWFEKSMLREEYICGGGKLIYIGNREEFKILSPDFCIEYLPVPTDTKARLALSLYREAINVNSVPYSFLGYFKIIVSI